MYVINMQKPYDGLVSSLSSTVVNMLVRIGQETACLPMCCSVSKQNCGLWSAIACVALLLSCQHAAWEYSCLRVDAQQLLNLC